MAACGSQPEPEARSRVSLDDRCGKVSLRLQGSYYTRTERADAPPELVDAPVGLNLLLLGPEHHGFLRVGEDHLHVWPVCVAQRLVQMPAVEDGACAGRGAGVYRWQREADRLVLARVQDDCLPRVYALTAHSYRWFNASGWNCQSRSDCGHKLEQIELLEETGDCEAAGCSGFP